MKKLASCILFLSTILLVACGGGGGSESAPPPGGGSAPPPPVTRDVQVSWLASREAGVNSPGGGYRVLVGGQVVKDVPYASGPQAPITTTIALASGTHSIAVRAYARLDSQGGPTGSFSAPSQAQTVIVP